MAPPVTIPTIDISPFLSDPTSGDAHKVVEEVRAACTTFGFLQVVGHGVSRSLQEELFRGAAAFFALPLEEKRKVDRAHPGACGKGFEVIGTQEQQKGLGGDYKEVRRPFYTQQQSYRALRHGTCAYSPRG
jgi:isopenicillin N synthase-like dioxygenase